MPRSLDDGKIPPSNPVYLLAVVCEHHSNTRKVSVS